MCDVTVMMSSESDVTLSQVVPYFNVLLDHIESFASHHNNTVQDAADKAKITLTSFYQKISDVYTIADVPDLRLDVQYYARDASPDAVPVSEKQCCGGAIWTIQSKLTTRAIIIINNAKIVQ